MNWGAKIVLGMGIFMLFIISLVSYMFYVHGRDTLIEDDYYENGIKYDQEFNASQQMLNHHAEPQINISKQYIVLKLKDSSAYSLTLKRASNQKDDQHFEGATKGTENLILIDRSDLPKGLWFLKLNWKWNGKALLFKHNLTL